MSDVLVRDLPADALQRLKDRALKHGRSLQSELQRILLQASQQSEPEQMTFEEAVHFAAEMRKKLEGKIEGTTAELIREDRDSR
jgi:plasmid stability protein